MRFNIMPILVALLCTTWVTATADELSPTDTFLQYRRALAAATAVDAVEPYMCKRVIKEIDNTPADVRPKMFEIIKEFAPKSVKVLSEKIDGDQATLSIAADTPPPEKGIKEQTEASVTLLREGGTWKIDKESWNSHTEVTGSPDTPTQ